MDPRGKADDAAAGSSLRASQSGPVHSDRASDRPSFKRSQTDLEAAAEGDRKLMSARRWEALQEKIPLLSSARHLTPRGTWESKQLSKDATDHDHQGKLLRYQHRQLLTPRIIFTIAKSAFAKPSVLWVGVYMLLLACGVAAFNLMALSSEQILLMQWTESLEKLMSVFISFMLGVYVQQSFKRWWCTALEFDAMLDSSKQMSCYAHSVGIDRAAIARLERYIMALNYVVSREAECTQTMMDDDNQVMQDTLVWLRDQGYLMDDEMQDLFHVERNLVAWHTSTIISSWIGELMGTCQYEPVGGLVTPVPPPMRVRMIALWQDTIKRMDCLKTYVILQIPFIYAQLLAFLVHTNNLVLGISAGVVITGTLADAMALHSRQDKHSLWPGIIAGSGKVSLLMAEVMLFTSFLHIAQLLSYPFGPETHNLPTETFIARMHAELSFFAKGREMYQRREKKRAGTNIPQAAVSEAKKKKNLDDGAKEFEEGEIGADVEAAGDDFDD